MTNNCTPTESSFLADVAEHKMTVIRDDGVYRHVQFKKPGTRCYCFDLITWPGFLCYSGDMGTFVFQRLEDMFEFFRTDRDAEWVKRKGLKLYINPGYWSEKVQAADRCGVEKFDPGRFRRVIVEYMVGWMRSAKERGTLDKAQRRELWEAACFDVLNRIDDGEQAAFSAANEFSWNTRHSGNHRGWSFTDLFDHRFTSYTYRFLWCCYAIAWGIEQYDQLTTSTEAIPA